MGVVFSRTYLCIKGDNSCQINAKFRWVTIHNLVSSDGEKGNWKMYNLTFCCVFSWLSFVTICFNLAFLFQSNSSQIEKLLLINLHIILHNFLSYLSFWFSLDAVISNMYLDNLLTQFSVEPTQYRVICSFFSHTKRWPKLAWHCILNFFMSAAVSDTLGVGWGR